MRGLGWLAAGGIVAACGSTGGDESTHDASAGAGGATGGSAGSGGTAGSVIDAGADGDGAIDAVDGSDGNVEGCVDIHVLSNDLPGPIEWNKGSAGIIERNVLWRDSTGLHFAWNPSASTQPSPMVLSTFEAGTGKVVEHRFLDSGVSGVAVSDDETLGLAAWLFDGDGGISTGVVITRIDDPSLEIRVPLWPYPGGSVVHAGWDGEAFAVHAYGASGYLEVARVTKDGTVLLTPQPFGVAHAFQADLQMATDPVSGVSFAVGGEYEDFPWLTGHLRDGTPIPGTETNGGKQLEPMGQTSLEMKDVFKPFVQAVPGGALVAWTVSLATSVGGGFVQRIDTTLAATHPMVAVPSQQVSGVWDQYRWMTIQPLPTGWWLAARRTVEADQFTFDGANLSGSPVVAYTIPPSGKGLDIRHLQSARWGDELWLGFSDASGPAPPPGGDPYAPFRIVRVKPGCVYESLWDLKK